MSGALEEAIGYFKSDAPARLESFGSALSVSADGNTLAVGVFGNAGVYVFARLNNVWEQQAYLTAPHPDVLDEFGITLSLSTDGNTLAIGASSEDGGPSGTNGDQDDDSISGSGAVYLC